MPNAFQRAVAAAMNTQRRLAAESIVYHAGRVTINITDAIIGRTTYERDEAGGTVLRSQVTDWLLERAALTVNGTFHEPAPGHRIVHTVNGRTITYEVQPISNEDHRPAHPAHDRIRIHTAEVAR